MYISTSEVFVSAVLDHSFIDLKEVILIMQASRMRAQQQYSNVNLRIVHIFP